mgnify:CR=1 FL=1
MNHNALCVIFVIILILIRYIKKSHFYLLIQPDGIDIAPLGAPDGLVNVGDYLIAHRISLGEVSATSLELSHGDLFLPDSPDGVIDTSDLILLLKLIQQ